ncbi:hypothetical protein GCK72_022359 [Caenorhabditis remanei]|uniref:DUF38 domain-containing protein n=1 Tax=Caenorhabditis remanei TaxID=31234 RepID=A0A6A5FTL7_CAERE|nr:hypothetical protein GCK72_022359 [Caenorhabditis remanei]KAF1745912.1 hypothetical protein GCK72_022359 [Caenorhabditis remanei]
MEIARVQVAIFLTAVSTNNTEVVLELLKTTTDDQKNVDNFINIFRGISIEVTSAEFNNVGDITLKVLIADMLPVVMVMTKNNDSLTRWKFTELKGHKPGSDSQKIFPKFNMSELGSSGVP